MDGIIDSSDVGLIDRGDLSREIPLESMVTNRNPTIAESNDVANTLLDGVHGLVLAAETAIGHDPVGIVIWSPDGAGVRMVELQSPGRGLVANHYILKREAACARGLAPERLEVDLSVTAGSKRKAGRLAVVPSVSPVHRFRHVLRTRISEHPALYLPFARRKYPGPSPKVIGPETELVIDGYTRSASTFAVYAFQLAQERPVRIAHHLHAPAQLMAAARMGVPALTLIREPEGAILSQLVQEPDVALRDALVAYARFYSCLLPCRASLVVADFDEVTRDFGAVIRRLNERFGTSFAEFVHTKGNMRECFDLIQERPTLSKALLSFESGTVTLSELRRARQHSVLPPQPPSSMDAWIPSAERERSKAVLREQWRQPGLSELRTRAETVYWRFVTEVGAGR